METSQQLLINKIIAAMGQYQASDLHLSVGNTPMLRVDGILVPIPEIPLLTPELIEQMISTWIDADDQKRLLAERHLVKAVTMENKKRFIIAIFFQQGHVSATLRLLPDRIPSLQEWGIPPVAQEFTKLESGLMLVTGPFGSGKTTTIASFIEYLNQYARKHIITLEQPVEFLFEDKQSVIEQQEVGKDVASFADGLRFALDEDADLVTVSDLAGADAFQQAILAAQAGVTVLAAVHANDFIAALYAMIYSFTPVMQDRLRSVLATTLVGAINQRLLPVRGGGTVLVTGVVVVDNAIRRVIEKGDLMQINNLTSTSQEHRMRSLDTMLKHYVDAGQITREVAVQNAIDPEIFLAAE